jgi:hypothetical protein
MNSELGAKLVDWALVTFSVVVVTYVVALPFVWFACAFWVGMGYRESDPPSTEVLDAQVWREFIRANLRLPLAFWPWFSFAFGIIALGVCRDIHQSIKAKS